MSRRVTGTAGIAAVVLLVALLGDGDAGVARSIAADRDRATQDTGRALEAQAADGAAAGSVGATASAAAAQVLVAAARASLAAELDAAHTTLEAGVSAPEAPRAALEAQIAAGASTGGQSSPASLVTAAALLRAARSALVQAQAAVPARSPVTPAPEVRTAPPERSCATTYTGPPFSTSAPTATGDGSNGHLPASAMTALSWSVDDLGTPFYLRSDAAAALERLNTAFTAAFGHPLDLDLTYRDYDTQVAMRAALGSIAAPPGTSAHGTGLAIDLPELPCSYGWDTRARNWLLQHGPDFGWVSPGWARASGSNPEYWHYEYRV